MRETEENSNETGSSGAEFVQRHWLRIALCILFLTILAGVLTPAILQERAMQLTSDDFYFETTPGSFKLQDSRARNLEEFLEELFGKNWLRPFSKVTLIALNRSKPEIPEKSFLYLKYFPDLEHLNFYRSNIGDDGLLALEGKRHIESLNLTFTKISDSGLASLKGMDSLRRLNMNDTHISDVGIAHLHGLTGLKFLTLYRTNVSRKGIADLKKHLPNCSIEW